MSGGMSPVLLAWLAGTVILTWAVPRSWQPATLGLLTAAFLLSCAPASFGILTAALLLCHLLVGRGRPLRTALAVFIVLLAAVLVWFKWGRHLDPADPSYVVIPLGLSYYVLRLLHYALEQWKGTLPEHSLAQLAGYLFFLPTLVAGPINRFPDYQRSLRRRRWDPRLFSRGCERILYGAAKVVILGNYLVSHRLAEVVNELAAGSPGGAAYLDCVRYGANLYFQFSGYSDIAIGFALLLGFEVPENFNYPFLARNIGDFWKRWHMTLSGWCRDYVYLPVAASSRSPRLGVLAAMLVLGLWHEFSLRYLLWGGYHGLGIACWQRFQPVKARWGWLQQGHGAALWTAVAWFATINFVILGFALTKEPDVPAALRVLRLVFTGG